MKFPRGLWQLLCLLVVVFGIVVPSLLLWSVVGVDKSEEDLDKTLRSLRTHERKPLDVVPEGKEANELRMQIHELEEIRASVREELRVLEQQRSKLWREIVAHRENLARVKKELSGAKTDLQEARGKLSKVTRDFYDKVDPLPQTVVNAAPIVILPPRGGVAAAGELAARTPPASLGPDSAFAACSFPLCFDAHRCPLTRPFRAFVYDATTPTAVLAKDGLATALISALKESDSFTRNAEEACVFVAVMDATSLPLNSSAVERTIHSLPNWGTDGMNHILIELSHIGDAQSVLERVRMGRAIIARSTVSPNKPFREGYDVLIPPSVSGITSWTELPNILPAFREYLVYFEGEYVKQKKKKKGGERGGGGGVGVSEMEALRSALQGVEKAHIELQCPGEGGGMVEGTHGGEWSLCEGWGHRESLYTQATFSFVAGPSNGGSALGPATYTRLIEALKYGSIPVIVGVTRLPLDDVILWDEAAVVVPRARFSEVHYILRSLNRDTVLQLRLRGRHLWLTYFSSALAIAQSVLSLVRSRTLHPPPVSPEFLTSPLVSVPGRRKRIQSPTLVQNFTVYSRSLWNRPPGPSFMYPTTPFRPGPVSGTQYDGLSEKMVARLPFHVIEGGGITGPAFEDLLLGNSEEEQFTVVMLTYQRNDVLIEALQRLKEVSFLNKVVVVWNNEQGPPHEMQWPNIDIPIEVVQVGRNSLNNRFLPLKEIETEAILSIDDDVHLRPDEIQFAFRVWREARDRIVGFPGRFHAYDIKHGSWLYNSNYTCELSMVLTGAAFFHKYYSYLYTYWQPQQVRQMVDQHMNCEDIAMNFLVSHITRKPPLKVTSRWTFRCPGCPETLSTSDSHFNERHVCMKLLTDLYGYVPLLYTQFRVDSVLFKTRLPSKLQKCYQFI